MKKNYTEKQAHELLYSFWESGLVPSNFTEDHTQYGDAITFIIQEGYFNFNDFTCWLIS
jgi:hypothetical protein